MGWEECEWKDGDIKSDTETWGGMTTREKELSSQHNSSPTTMNYSHRAERHGVECMALEPTNSMRSQSFHFCVWISQWLVCAVSAAAVWEVSKCDGTHVNYMRLSLSIFVGGICLTANIFILCTSWREWDEFVWPTFGPTLSLLFSLLSSLSPSSTGQSVRWFILDTYNTLQKWSDEQHRPWMERTIVVWSMLAVLDSIKSVEEWLSERTGKMPHRPLRLMLHLPCACPFAYYSCTLCPIFSFLIVVISSRPLWIVV